MTKHTILFLAANPVGTDRLALDEEARAIQEELERSGHRDKFEFVTRWAVRPLDLLRELRRLKPTVVHFSGHGSGGKAAKAGEPEQLRREASSRRVALDEPGPAHDERPGLFFQAADGQPQLVSTAALQKVFGAAGSSVKLVVLSACYSEVQADALLAHIGCVVGMSGAIHEDAARNFAIGFYGGVGEHESVAAAYQQGCAAISLEGLPDSERPKLNVGPGVEVDRFILAESVDGPSTATKLLAWTKHDTEPQAVPLEVPSTQLHQDRDKAGASGPDDGLARAVVIAKMAALPTPQRIRPPVLDAESLIAPALPPSVERGELHVADVTLREPRVDETVWIAIMGTKGGSGKSTIATAMAELIASKGNNVLLIDADMENAGLTKYLDSRATQQPFIRTVLDAAYDKAEGTSSPTPPCRTWDVTPPYLQALRFGRIRLLPARLKIDSRDAWLPLARIQPDEHRNALVLELLNELWEGVRSVGENVDCIIIDAGAENNPLVSAAFVKSDYGFLVSSPNPEFRFEIQRLESLHRSRYPSFPFSGMNVIINRATAESAHLWNREQGVYFLQEDPLVQRTSALGKDYDFEGVGLNRFFRQVLYIMKQTFRTGDDQMHLLPDEVDVWIAPFIREIKGIPDRILRRWYLRFLLPAVAAVVLAGAALLTTSMLEFVRTADAVADVETVEPVEATNEDHQAAARLAKAVNSEYKEQLTFETERVILKGNVPNKELKKVQLAANEFPNHQLALVRAALRHEEKIQAASGQQDRRRLLGAAGSIAGIALIAAGIFVVIQLGRRKRMLHGIVGLETKSNDELRAFAERLLLMRTTKPDLIWLRRQYRAHSVRSIDSWFAEGESRAARL